MKLSTTLLVAVASADDKKVPPRTPLQRLATLKRFSADILNDWWFFLPSKDKWIEKFANNADRMERAYNRPTCGYFDPYNKPHGGPDANPDLRPNGKPRRQRRELEDDDEGLYDEDGFLRYDNNDPEVGIKQITTGFRKWADRYINECWGQRKNKYQKDRMNKFYNLLLAHYRAYNENNN